MIASGPCVTVEVSLRFCYWPPASPRVRGRVRVVLAARVDRRPVAARRALAREAAAVVRAAAGRAAALERPASVEREESGRRRGRRWWHGRELSGIERRGRKRGGRRRCCRRRGGRDRRNRGRERRGRGGSGGTAGAERRTRRRRRDGGRERRTRRRRRDGRSRRFRGRWRTWRWRRCINGWRSGPRWLGRHRERRRVGRPDDAGGDGAAAFNPCPPVPMVCKIMPLGDSITWGVGSSGAGGGYRVPLFLRSLTLTNNQSITFVGHRTANRS